VNDKDKVELRCETADDEIGHRLPAEEEAMHRSRTPATVAEPDSTMSNDAGPADVEPAECHATVNYVIDESSGTDTGRHHVSDNDAVDVMSSSDTGTRNFSERFGLERILGFDVMRTGTRSEVESKLDMKHADDRQRVEPTTSELRRTSEKEETVFGRLNSLIPRKRHNADQSGNIHNVLQPPDSMRKKHRPDPLVLVPSSAEHYGYPSWLRSPRVRDGSSLIPYTPPPMLSPARRAPGLFWATATGDNQPVWSLFRQPSAFTCESCHLTLSLS